MPGLSIPWDVIDPEGELREAMNHTLNPDGSARHTLWSCNDGWVVGYTTERIRGGKFDGKFAAMAYKPVGKGSRSGDAEEHVRTYFRGFTTRKSAKARAEVMHRQHSS